MAEAINNTRSGENATQQNHTPIPRDFLLFDPLTGMPVPSENRSRNRLVAGSAVPNIRPADQFQIDPGVSAIPIRHDADVIMNVQTRGENVPPEYQMVQLPPAAIEDMTDDQINQTLVDRDNVPIPMRHRQNRVQRPDAAMAREIAELRREITGQRRMREATPLLIEGGRPHTRRVEDYRAQVVGHRGPPQLQQQQTTSTVERIKQVFRPGPAAVQQPQSAESIVAAQKIQATQEQLRLANERMQQLQLDLQQTRDARDKMDSQRSTAESRAAAAEQQYKDREQAINDAEAAVTTLTGQITTLTGEKESALQAQQNAENAKTKAEQDAITLVQTITTEKQALQQQLEQEQIEKEGIIQARLTQNQRVAEQTRRALSDLDTQRREAEERLAQEQANKPNEIKAAVDAVTAKKDDEHTETKTKLTQAEAELKTVNEKITAVEDVLKTIDPTDAANEVKIKTLIGERDRLRQLADQYNEVTQQLADLEPPEATNTEKIENLKQQKAQLEQRIAEIEAEATQKRAKQEQEDDELAEMISALTPENDQLMNELLDAYVEGRFSKESLQIIQQQRSELEGTPAFGQANRYTPDSGEQRQAAQIETYIESQGVPEDESPRMAAQLLKLLLLKNAEINQTVLESQDTKDFIFLIDKLHLHK